MMRNYPKDVDAENRQNDCTSPHFREFCHPKMYTYFKGALKIVKFFIDMFN